MVINEFESGSKTMKCLIKNVCAAALLCTSTFLAAGSLTSTQVADLDKPWALAFLPDGRLLVTERDGALKLITLANGSDVEVASMVDVTGLPSVDAGGQGGLGDVALHPDFETNRWVYLSYAEAGLGDTRGAAVSRGRLVESEGAATLSELVVIWRQYPKVLGRGHFGHRLLFDESGYLWISSGDRQKFTPAQDMQSNLGKVLRLNDDGSAPADNPFVGYLRVDPLVDDEAVYDQVWSLGHRNPLGMDFDLAGNLWEIEMGPAGGDELNLIARGANYGYPVVSNGDHYDGRDIPNHDTRPEYVMPAITWTPVISPGDLMIYRGSQFPWRGEALVAGLSSKALIRVSIAGDKPKEVERFDMGMRVRSVAEAPDGSIWVLEDERRDSLGRLFKLEWRQD